MPISVDRFIAYLLIIVSGLIGGGALLLFMLFLYFGPLRLMGLNLSSTNALLLDTVLCFLFFIQHSVMIRNSFRQKLIRYIKMEYEPAFFSIIAGLFLLTLLFLWQDVSQTLFVSQGTFRLLLRTIFLLSLGIFAWGLWSLGEFDPFGIISILNDIRGKEKTVSQFIIKGPYRFVRHPLYTAMIMMFWSYPILTLDRFIFNCLFTAYMVVGTLLEERDLVRTFGADYLAYQEKVPMLVPYRNYFYTGK
jgi:protein-S-isoprenylcysteine O-methyltransferase Ste14